MKEDKIEECKRNFSNLAEQYAGIAMQIAELKGLVKAKICSLQKITNLMNELTKQIENDTEETNKF